MKTQKIGSALLTGIMAFSMVPAMGGNVLAASDIAVNSTNFPDKNFRTCVSTSFDTNKSGTLSADEIKKAKYLSCYDKQVSSLKGVEYLTALTSLSAGSNNITSVDLTKNVNLESVNLSDNKIKSVNLTKNVKLKSVNVSENAIKALDLSKNTKLETLNAYSNKLTGISLPKGSTLKKIDLDSNLFTAFNTSNLTGLETLSLENNKLSSVTLNNKYLRSVDLFKNANLTKIDVSKCPALELLELGGTKISAINVKGNKYLKGLGLSGTKISSIDVTANPQLEILYVDQTNIKSLNVTKNTYLTDLNAHDIAISSLDLSKNKNLRYLNIRGTKIERVNIADCTDLVALYKKGPTYSGTYSVSYDGKINGKYCYIYISTGTQLVISKPTKTPSKACVAFVERMYTTALKRKAETAGRDYWAEQLCTHKMSGELVGACFFMSDEMISYKLSNDEFVNRLYATFMDRKPDADGKKYWVQFLKDGHNRLEVVMGFTRSPEFIAKCEAAGILPY